MKSKWQAFVAGMLAGGTGLFLMGCGGNNSAGSNLSNNNSSTSAPTMVSAGDAPMSNVLAALVTISAVTFTNSSGSSVSLLSQARTIELTSLGGIRAPLELSHLAAGTYNSVSLTVSAAQITYLDSNNQPVVANATLASPTATITLNPAFTVSSTAAVDLRFDFDLSQSLDLTGSTVTFTPTVSAAVALANNEAATERVLYINGSVSAVTSNTITVTEADTQLSVTLNVNSNTTFGDNLSMASIQVGTSINAEAQLGTDGTLTALLIESANGGAAVASGDTMVNGIVTRTTVSGGAITAFSMVARGGMGSTALGRTVNVTVGSGTTFKDTDAATDAGLITYSSSQNSIFPGSGVRVVGAFSGNAASGFTLAATQVRPDAVAPFGLLNAAVQTTVSGGFVLPLLLDNRDPVAHFGSITTISAVANSNTVFDGASLTSANVSSATVGTPLTARGFLAVQAGVYTDFAANIREESH